MRPSTNDSKCKAVTTSQPLPLEEGMRALQRHRETLEQECKGNFAQAADKCFVNEYYLMAIEFLHKAIAQHPKPSPLTDEYWQVLQTHYEKLITCYFFQIESFCRSFINDYRSAIKEALYQPIQQCVEQVWQEIEAAFTHLSNKKSREDIQRLSSMRSVIKHYNISERGKPFLKSSIEPGTALHAFLSEKQLTFSRCIELLSQWLQQLAQIHASKNPLKDLEILEYYQVFYIMTLLMNCRESAKHCLTNMYTHVKYCEEKKLFANPNDVEKFSWAKKQYFLNFKEKLSELHEEWKKPYDIKNYKAAQIPLLAGIKLIKEESILIEEQKDDEAKKMMFEYYSVASETYRKLAQEEKSDVDKQTLYRNFECDHRGSLIELLEQWNYDNAYNIPLAVEHYTLGEAYALLGKLQDAHRHYFIARDILLWMGYNDISSDLQAIFAKIEIHLKNILPESKESKENETSTEQLAEFLDKYKTEGNFLRAKFLVDHLKNIDHHALISLLTLEKAQRWIAEIYLAGGYLTAARIAITHQEVISARTFNIEMKFWNNIILGKIFLAMKQFNMAKYYFAQAMTIATRNLLPTPKLTDNFFYCAYTWLELCEKYKMIPPAPSARTLLLMETEYEQLLKQQRSSALCAITLSTMISYPVLFRDISNTTFIVNAWLIAHARELLPGSERTPQKLAVSHIDQAAAYLNQLVIVSKFSGTNYHTIYQAIQNQLLALAEEQYREVKRIKCNAKSNVIQELFKTYDGLKKVARGNRLPVKRSYTLTDEKHLVSVFSNKALYTDPKALMTFTHAPHPSDDKKRDACQTLHIIHAHEMAHIVFMCIGKLDEAFSALRFIAKLLYDMPRIPKEMEVTLVNFVECAMDYFLTYNRWFEALQFLRLLGKIRALDKLDALLPKMDRITDPQSFHDIAELHCQLSYDFYKNQKHKNRAYTVALRALSFLNRISIPNNDNFFLKTKCFHLISIILLSRKNHVDSMIYLRKAIHAYDMMVNPESQPVLKTLLIAHFCDLSPRMASLQMTSILLATLAKIKKYTNTLTDCKSAVQRYATFYNFYVLFSNIDFSHIPFYKHAAFCKEIQNYLMKELFIDLLPDVFVFNVLRNFIDNDIKIYCQIMLRGKEHASLFAQNTLSDIVAETQMDDAKAMQQELITYRKKVVNPREKLIAYLKLIITFYNLTQQPSAKLDADNNEYPESKQENFRKIHGMYIEAIHMLVILCGHMDDNEFKEDSTQKFLQHCRLFSPHRFAVRLNETAQLAADCLPKLTA